MIDIDRKKQQAINDFYETHCEAPHEIDLLFGFDSGYNLGLDERDALSAQVERLREALETITSEAERCDSWEFFPSDPIEQARAALDETPAQALAEVEAAAFMAGQADCGIDPSYSSAMKYVNRTTNKSGTNNEH